MISLRHGWGLQPTQTAVWFHCRHIYNDWAHCYTYTHITYLSQILGSGHIDMLSIGIWKAALRSYTHPTWLRFLGSGLLVESKWCHYFMVEAGSQLKLSIHILYLQSVWAHWYAVHRHTAAALQIIPALLTFVRFWGSGSLAESKWYVITSWLRLTANSNCFPHPYKTYTKCLSTLICCPKAYNSSLTQLYLHYSQLGSDFGGLCQLWSQNDDITSWLRLTATSNCFPRSILSQGLKSCPGPKRYSFAFPYLVIPV
jgi:hypothetical protein